MKTKAEIDFEAAKTELLGSNERLVNKLLEMIGARDRLILELEAELGKLKRTDAPAE